MPITTSANAEGRGSIESESLSLSPEICVATNLRGTERQRRWRMACQTGRRRHHFLPLPADMRAVRRQGSLHRAEPSAVGSGNAIMSRSRCEEVTEAFTVSYGSAGELPWLVAWESTDEGSRRQPRAPPSMQLASSLDDWWGFLFASHLIVYIQVGGEVAVTRAWAVWVGGGKKRKEEVVIKRGSLKRASVPRRRDSDCHPESLDSQHGRADRRCVWLGGSSRVEKRPDGVEGCLM
ncbi:hypothetical protein CP533_5491 [Ophiocordyceps camponoti-saundersi (nom. inval.)]|nr:hypothetical protein CP533_5491 [Ophiocordyceps camponoti-saundersi (nom. inval.)]